MYNRFCKNKKAKMTIKRITMAEISQGTCIVEKTELTCGHCARCPDKSSSISSIVP